MNTSYKNNRSLAKVISYFGGIPKLAAVLGIGRQAIYQWDKIPLARAFQIELITKGHFKASELNKKIASSDKNNKND